MDERRSEGLRQPENKDQYGLLVSTEYEVLFIYNHERKYDISVQSFILFPF